MSGFDPITSLAEADIAVENATDEQRAVLASLSEAEVGVLASVSARLNAAGPEVSGHESVTGGVFW